MNTAPDPPRPAEGSGAVSPVSQPGSVGDGGADPDLSGPSHRVKHRCVHVVVVCWLVALRSSSMLVYLRNASAQTILRAATLR